jgi:hypothetical protein
LCSDKHFSGAPGLAKECKFDPEGYKYYPTIVF